MNYDRLQARLNVWQGKLEVIERALGQELKKTQYLQSLGLSVLSLS